MGVGAGCWLKGSPEEVPGRRWRVTYPEGIWRKNGPSKVPKGISLDLLFLHTTFLLVELREGLECAQPLGQSSYYSMPCLWTADTWTTLPFGRVPGAFGARAYCLGFTHRDLCAGFSCLHRLDLCCAEHHPGRSFLLCIGQLKLKNADKQDMALDKVALTSE